MSAALKYRKRPLVIEAMRYDGFPKTAAALVEWSGGKVSGDVAVTVATLEGEMRVAIGDFVIKGIEGEFYPCKPAIFEATYEAVPAASPIPEEHGDDAITKRIKDRIRERLVGSGGEVLLDPDNVKAVVREVLLDELTAKGLPRAQVEPLVNLLAASMRVA